MSEDPILAFINTDPGARAAEAELYYKVKTGEDIAPGSELEKLHLRYKKRNVERFHVSLSPDFRGTAEDLAKSLNAQEDWLDDPVNNLTSRIEGNLLFGKRETVMCLENRMQYCSESKSWIEVPLTSEEKYKLRRTKEEIDLIRAALDMIKELNEKVKNNG